MSKGKLERLLTEFNEDETIPVKSESTLSSKYMVFYNAIDKYIEKKRNSVRKRLDEAMNVVLDGNLYSLDGFSSDSAIENVQKKAGLLMKDLCKKFDLCELDTVSVNSALETALSQQENEETVYFQTLHENRNGEYVSSKPSNFFRIVLAHPNKILMLFKNIYLLGSSLVIKELISFVWIFLETIMFFSENSNISITPEHVLVILYIQKYGNPSIKENELVSLITKKRLSFDSNKLSELDLKEDEIYDAINKLSSFGVIEICSEEITLVESVKLKVSIE